MCSTSTSTCRPRSPSPRRTTTTTTDRNGPKIFVGEWATREGDPTPNLAGGAGRCRLDDRPGAQQRPDHHGQLRAAVCQRESRRHAVGDRPDRLRRADQLWLAELLGAGDVLPATWAPKLCPPRWPTPARARLYLGHARSEAAQALRQGGQRNLGRRSRWLSSSKAPARSRRRPS